MTRPDHSGAGWSKAADRTAPGAGAPGPVDLAGFVGVWLNTHRETDGITRMVLSGAPGDYGIEVTAAGEPKPWGRAVLSPYSAEVGAVAANGFRARYEFGFMDVELVAYFVKGLIVCSHYNTFHDDSGRRDYFAREFFFRERRTGA